MTTNDLLLKMREAGFTLKANGDILEVSPAQCIDSELSNSIRARKADLMALLKSEAARYAKVLDMLDGKKYALLVEDATTDPVICTVAIRGKASFELEIPLKYYDGLALLELIETHSETLSEPRELSGKANPSPSSNGSGPARPDRRAA